MGYDGRMRRAALVLAVWGGCVAPTTIPKLAPPPGGSATTDTAGGHTGIPWVTTTLGETPPIPSAWRPFEPTEPVEPLPACVTRQLVTSGGVLDAGRSPDGTVWAAPVGGEVLLRGPDGAYATEALPEGLTFLRSRLSPSGALFGYTADAQLGAFRVLRRDAPGVWSELPFDRDTTVLALQVEADDDLRLLVADFGDYSRPPVVELWRWDGSQWVRTIGGALPSGATSLAVLSDGTEVISGMDAVHVVSGGEFDAVVPAPLGTDLVVAAPDDTLVAYSGRSVAIGTVADGFVDRTPPLAAGTYVSTVWAGGADDVLAATETFDFETSTQYAAVWHWDGGVWTGLPGELVHSRIAAVFGPADDVVVVGRDRDLWGHGDLGGVPLERDSWGLGDVSHVIRADRVVGEAWALGLSRTIQQWTGGRWITHPVADRLNEQLLDIAVDGGFGVVVSQHHAMVIADRHPGAVTELDPAVYWSLAAAGGGAAFVIGTQGLFVSARRVQSDGWTDLDSSTWPADTWAPRAAWADGPQDLWLAVERPPVGGAGSGGGVVHWDGTAWALAVDGLPARPHFLTRLSDGRLAFSIIDVPGVTDPSLYTVEADGSVLPVEGLLPDVRAAQLWDGSQWMFTPAAGDPTRGYTRSVQQGTSGGPLVEHLAGANAFDAWDGTAWSSSRGWTWTLRCDP